MVKDVFEKNRYDFVVVWNQVTAFLFEDILTKQFSNRYCVNIRDYHYDKLLPIRLRVGKTIKKAAFNTISSEAFFKFLPKGNYLMLHSLNETMLSSLPVRTEMRKKNEPIRILNIGQIRWVENIYPLIDELANDKRFEINIAGVGAEQIERYVDGKNITNVNMHGRFPPEQTVDYLKNADVLFNLYGVGNIHVDTALSIKLYYAIYLEIPVMTYSGTYIDEVANKAGIGFTVIKNDFSGIGDRLYDWYHDQNHQEIHRHCVEYEKEIRTSHEQLRSTLDKYFGNRDTTIEQFSLM